MEKNKKPQHNTESSTSDAAKMVECPLCQDSYPVILIQQHIEAAHAEKPKPSRGGSTASGSFGTSNKRIFNSFSSTSLSSSISTSRSTVYHGSNDTTKKPKVSSTSPSQDDERDYANCTNHAYITQHRLVAQSTGLNTSMPYYKSLVINHYYGQDSENCISDIMSLLRPLFESNARKVGATLLLCSELSFYCSGLGDIGWGCGYRNIQMMVSCLQHVPAYNERLFGGCEYVPGIGKLQECIESTWENGFDIEGQNQLRGKIIGTSKFIGSSEGCALIRNFGIPATLIDLHSPTGEKNQHPALFNWVWSYFENATNQNVSISDNGKRFVPPLYLQHDGHSRTIIGIERKKNGNYSLLVLDPGSNISKIRNAIENNNPMTFKRTVKQVTHSQYQMIAIGRVASTPSFFGKSTTCFVVQQPLVMEKTEFQESKKLTSLRLS